MSGNAPAAPSQNRPAKNEKWWLRRSLAIWLVVAGLLPPGLILYARGLALLVDKIGNPGHPRLVLFLHYAGKLAELVLQAGVLTPLVIFGIATLLREELRALVRGLEELDALGVKMRRKIVPGAPPTEINSPWKPPNTNSTGEGASQ